MGSERLWARPAGDDEYVLENVPWFVRGYACGDRVRAAADDDGVLWVSERVAWSGRYTVRVVPFGSGALEGSHQAVIDRMASLGVDCEGAEPAYNIVALDIPPNAELRTIKALLQRGEGWCGYEEGCIDDRWATL